MEVSALLLIPTIWIRCLQSCFRAIPQITVTILICVTYFPNVDTGLNRIFCFFSRTGFEVIPMPSNTNKSPVIHIEHNLGLQSWCVKYIYEYAHRLLLRHKAECFKLSGGVTPSSTSIVGNTSGALLMSGTGNNAIIKYLNCAILINPDVATFWNLRRQLFAKNRLDITKEFQFSAVVLSKKPKSNEAFAYRRWLYLFQSK